MTSAEDPGRTTATDLAASALLGALLWDPGRIDDVAGWLEPVDFPHWAHRAIYQTLTGLVADGRPVELLALPEILISGEYHDAHVDRSGNGPLSAAALHSLLAMTPATPRADEHARAGGTVARSEHVRYARVVLEDSIRRQVAAAGTRIDQYAREVIGIDVDAAAAMLSPMLAETTARLVDLTSRMGSGALGGRIAAALAPGSTTARAELVSALETGVGNGEVQLSAASVTRAEYSLIGSCLVSPEVRDQVAGRLLAEDFTTPEAAATWDAITSLMRRGEPIDFVLVAVEVERHGAADRGPGIDAGDLARLAARADAASGYRAINTIARAAMYRAAQHAHHELTELAGDRSQPGHVVLRGAQTAVAAAEATTRRLGGHTGRTTAAMFAPPPGQVPQPRPRQDPVGPPGPVAGGSEAAQQTRRRR